MVQDSRKKDSVIKGTPVVCAVGDVYIICVPVKRKALISIQVGSKTYFCHSNGIRRSDVTIQKFTIPMEELNNARSYTVTHEAVIKRTPKLCEKEPAVSVTYEFRPVTDRENINIYHLSDVHGLKSLAKKAGAFFDNDLDLLIMNGDISSQSDNRSDILIIYEIASSITGGNIPCIISRGNHDLRGKYAEKLEDFLPTENGRTYYTVKLGPLWFLLLDCGEDKEDSHREYSGTVCCHAFREEQTEYIKKLKENAANEYLADKYTHRIIISHVPFNYDNNEECKGERPFNIEHDIFSEWCAFARDEVKADFMLSGHLHRLGVIRGGSPEDNKNISIDTILGGSPIREGGKAVSYGGAAITVGKNEIRVRFTDEKKKVLSEEKIRSFRFVDAHAR